MKLIAARCPVCAQMLKVEQDDLIVACGNCRTAIRLDQGELQRVQVVYATPGPGAMADRWLPMWIFQGKVTISKRDTQGRGDNSWREFWEGPRYFYIPAWELSLSTLQEVSVPLAKSQPRYRPLPANQQGQLSLQPVTVSPEDARKLLEFLVLEIEVQRKDWLKDIAFEVAASEASLWALPADSGRRLVALEERS